MSRVIALVYMVLLLIFVFKDSCNSAVVYIDHDFGQPDSEKDCGTKEFLEKGLNSLKFPLIQLPSKSNDVKKYNILSNDDVKFVYVFLGKSSTYASSMSDVCQHGFGKSDNLNLYGSIKICAFILKFFGKL